MNPLDQLADITPPNSVSIWPLAWGYWLVIAAAVISVVCLVIAIVDYKKKRKVKYETLQVLSHIAPTDPYFAHKTQVALKKISAHYVPFISTQTLHGGKWTSLLLSIYRGKHPAQFEQAIAKLNLMLYAKQPEYAANKPIPVNENVHNIQQQAQMLSAVKDFVNTSFPLSKDSKTSLLNYASHGKTATTISTDSTHNEDNTKNVKVDHA